MTGDLYETPVRYEAAYDELSADGVTPRPHWADLMESLLEIGDAELERRWIRAERRIRENGITYNIYSDPLGANRAWQIDIIPLLIPAEEWRYIEAGIIQRAQLLGLLLEDLYGSQDLVARGHFPAALLYASPAFLRPLVGVHVPAHSYLHMLAIDLARSPDGQWWVLADRHSHRRGLCAENRAIASDASGSQPRRQRLAPFFRAQRSTYQSCPVRQLIVTHPGTAGKTYFEHSTRYLVHSGQRADRTVRGRQVIRRPSTVLSGRCHLRRVDDSFCDPSSCAATLFCVPGPLTPRRR